LALFERFTERARLVVVLAQEEARALTHNYIGTEHILLGLLREQEGLAAAVLESLEITLERVRAQVVRIVGSGEELTSGQIPFTPRAKKVLEIALREALSLGHNYIGTEHILLGLVRENDGVAVRILLDFDADAERIRNEVIRMLSSPGAPRRVQLQTSRAAAEPLDQSWFGGLARVFSQLEDEIARGLGRAPDSGDLLLALACAPDTRAAAALRASGVDLEALKGAVEQVRSHARPSEAELTRKLEEVRHGKREAAASEEFETAATLRDQERELAQAVAAAAVSPAVIVAMRACLGLRSTDPRTASSG
jgi:ATP-dependent Clp protease ATP-binding subunit ClpA